MIGKEELIVAKIKMENVPTLVAYHLALRYGRGVGGLLGSDFPIESRFYIYIFCLHMFRPFSEHNEH